MSNKLVKIFATYDGYDIRVPSPYGGEAGAYYTDSRRDARDTARHMYYEPELQVIIRNVDAHPET